MRHALVTVTYSGTLLFEFQPKSVQPESVRHEALKYLKAAIPNASEYALSLEGPSTEKFSLVLPEDSLLATFVPHPMAPPTPLIVRKNEILQKQGDCICKALSRQFWFAESPKSLRFFADSKEISERPVPDALFPSPILIAVPGWPAYRLYLPGEVHFLVAPERATVGDIATFLRKRSNRLFRPKPVQFMSRLQSDPKPSAPSQNFCKEFCVVDHVADVISKDCFGHAVLFCLHQGDDKKLSKGSSSFCLLLKTELIVRCASSSVRLQQDLFGRALGKTEDLLFFHDGQLLEDDFDLVNVRPGDEVHAYVTMKAFRFDASAVPELEEAVGRLVDFEPRLNVGNKLESLKLAIDNSGRPISLTLDGVVLSNSAELHECWSEQNSPIIISRPVAGRPPEVAPAKSAAVAPAAVAPAESAEVAPGESANARPSADLPSDSRESLRSRRGSIGGHSPAPVSEPAATKITFEFPDHPDIWLKFQARDSVASAKERLARIYQITPDRIQLFFRGLELTDAMMMSKLRLRPTEKVEMSVLDDLQVVLTTWTRIP
jgi:hypothetical protein